MGKIGSLCCLMPLQVLDGFVLFGAHRSSEEIDAEEIASLSATMVAAAATRSRRPDDSRFNRKPVGYSPPSGRRTRIF